MGGLRCDLPIFIAQWRSCLNAIWMHSSWHWSYLRVSVSCRIGFHVWDMAAHISFSLESDP